MEYILIALVVSSIICGGLGCYVSTEKNRPGGEGLLLGILFGLIGVIIAALLPTLEQPFQSKEKSKQPINGGKRRDNRPYIMCPRCKTSLPINSPAVFGKEVRCPSCTGTFIVPEEELNEVLEKWGAVTVCIVVIVLIVVAITWANNS